MNNSRRKDELERLSDPTIRFRLCNPLSEVTREGGGAREKVTGEKSVYCLT